MPASTASPEDPAPQSHSWLDDVQGFAIGSVLCSLGVALFSAGGLLTSGTAGIAFLLHYLTGLGVGLLFFLINLPFFALAYWRMGWLFALKSFIAVALLGLLVEMQPYIFKIAVINPIYAAIAGGLVLGMGALALVRHGGSLGGVNILAVYLQQTRGIRAGKLQMAVDTCITIAAVIVLPLEKVAYSVLGALLLGAVLAINHKPGRYMGV
ncbi:MAG: YitT family protein [Pseudomonadota bacterium]